MTVADIYSLAEEGLKQIEEEIACSCYSKLSIINEIANSFFKSGGKRVRSLLLLLTAALSGYTGKRTKALGAIIEQVHTASLMHDDVVDGSTSRRGAPSTNAVYGNQAAVLTGDCLYTSAFLTLLKKYPTPIVTLIVNAVNQMSAAEVLQLKRASDLNITMQEYLSIVFGKTAALFSAACACGSLIAKPTDKRNEKLLYSLGMHIGCAFQLQDDLMDYYADIELLGKKAGTDLAEKKPTLPIILLCRYCAENPEDYSAVKQLFLSHKDNDEKLAELLGWLERYNIRPKAQTVITGYIKKAQKILMEFEPSVYREALMYLVNSLKESSTVGKELSVIMKDRLIK
ncbi:MAG: polyprenyl synthetase family protein [Deferribacteraceae bacterium]|jgi:octaprenyl-diphosphate synthase|nr:polyprenyl synthetase family protein [Deferribacteraceae bacterium]